MIRKYLVVALLPVAYVSLGCGAGDRNASVPQTDLRPFKEIDAVEMFEGVLHEKGYTTARKEPIYVVGYGEWLVDLWVEGEKLPLVIEYLTDDDRKKLGGKLQSSKVGEKFRLVAVATRELAEGEELTQLNSRFAVVFDDRDYIFQPNPRSEDRHEVTLLEIKRRLRTDIVDVVEELEKVMAEQAAESEGK